ncbi:nuclear transport factor 2 family protein [Streptomyces sp. NPDC047014]|uniref:nuclear transport factor 2 family protein n=1 Tax=Streptomyces sp. NPDC047014 TaxID=3155736 RepID=UPI0033ECF81C
MPAAGDGVLALLHAYARGLAAHFRTALLPGARVEGMRDGAFVSWALEDYCGLFTGRPAADEASRTCRTDVFLLVRGDDWRIAHKIYDRRRQTSTQSR